LLPYRRYRQLVSTNFCFLIRNLYSAADLGTINRGKIVNNANLKQQADGKKIVIKDHRR